VAPSRQFWPTCSRSFGANARVELSTLDLRSERAAGASVGRLVTTMRVLRSSVVHYQAGICPYADGGDSADAVIGDIVVLTCVREVALGLDVGRSAMARPSRQSRSVWARLPTAASGHPEDQHCRDEAQPRFAHSLSPGRASFSRSGAHSSSPESPSDTTCLSLCRLRYRSSTYWDPSTTRSTQGDRPRFSGRTRGMPTGR